MTSRLITAHPEFESKILENERTIHVYLPPAYEQGDESYPVLYMQDGQNLFDPRQAAFGVEWEAGKSADRLIAEESMEPIIIVGIENTPQRKEEYSPPFGADPGRSDEYARFLLEELKPFIDEEYRTKPGRDETGIGGSSLGGLAALAICVENHDSFGHCAAFSPSIWLGGPPFLAEFERTLPRMAHINFRVLVGKHEGGGMMKHGARAIRDIFRRSDHPRWRYREFANTRHDEASWAKQLPLVLPELYPA
ncbi:MAG: alpha/beta hydrolase [Planctomycetota bacterium]|jgi:predicted alpha/beta superfamily hydrolase